ncbi:MAG: AAA family ATPase, partial [bacterium]
MSWLDEYAKIEEKARRGAGLLDRLGYGDNGKDRSASALHQEYVYRRMSDIAAKPIVWLWEGRIPRGKVSMVAGHPGLGKSQLTLSVAAIVSVGGMWPVDRTQCDAGSVIILSGEDDAEDTIRPRLEATGADLRRIYILDSVRDTNQHGEPFNRPFTLSAEDILRLRAMIAHLGEVALVVIDPVSAYLGVVDSHRNSEVREVLTLLADMAADTGVAVLCVSHLNKAGGPEALMRVMGSLGFVAAARSAYLVAKDPEDGDRRLFLPMKNNLAVDTGGMAFRVRPQDLGRGIHTSCVEWDSEQVTITADEALAPVGDPEERSDLEDAKAFLRVLLCDGPVPSKECIARAKEDGISVITLRRAKKYLKINSEKQFGTGKWVWVSRACASET